METSWKERPPIGAPVESTSNEPTTASVQPYQEATARNQRAIEAQQQRRHLLPRADRLQSCVITSTSSQGVVLTLVESDKGLIALRDLLVATLRQAGLHVMPGLAEICVQGATPDVVAALAGRAASLITMCRMQGLNPSEAEQSLQPLGGLKMLLAVLDNLGTSFEFHVLPKGDLACALGGMNVDLAQTCLGVTLLIQGGFLQAATALLTCLASCAHRFGDRGAVQIGGLIEESLPKLIKEASLPELSTMRALIEKSEVFAPAGDWEPLRELLQGRLKAMSDRTGQAMTAQDIRIVYEAGQIEDLDEQVDALLTAFHLAKTAPSLACADLALWALETLKQLSEKNPRQRELQRVVSDCTREWLWEIDEGRFAQAETSLRRSGYLIGATGALEKQPQAPEGPPPLDLAVVCAEQLCRGGSNRAVPLCLSVLEHLTKGDMSAKEAQQLFTVTCSALRIYMQATGPGDAIEASLKLARFSLTTRMPGVWRDAICKCFAASLDVCRSHGTSAKAALSVLHALYLQRMALHIEGLAGKSVGDAGVNLWSLYQNHCDAAGGLLEPAVAAGLFEQLAATCKLSCQRTSDGGFTLEKPNLEGLALDGLLSASDILAHELFARYRALFPEKESQAYFDVCLGPILASMLLLHDDGLRLPQSRQVAEFLAVVEGLKNAVDISPEEWLSAIQWLCQYACDLPLACKSAFVQAFCEGNDPPTLKLSADVTRAFLRAYMGQLHRDGKDEDWDLFLQSSGRITVGGSVTAFLYAVEHLARIGQDVRAARLVFVWCEQLQLVDEEKLGELLSYAVRQWLSAEDKDQFLGLAVELILNNVIELRVKEQLLQTCLDLKMNDHVADHLGVLCTRLVIWYVNQERFDDADRWIGIINGLRLPLRREDYVAVTDMLAQLGVIAPRRLMDRLRNFFGS